VKKDLKINIQNTLQSRTRRETSANSSSSADDSSAEQSRKDVDEIAHWLFNLPRGVVINGLKKLHSDTVYQKLSTNVRALLDEVFFITTFKFYSHHNF
jgi:hypothetical protein